MHLLRANFNDNTLPTVNQREIEHVPKPVTKRLFLKDVHKDRTLGHDKCFAVAAFQEKGCKLIRMHNFNSIYLK